MFLIGQNIKSKLHGPLNQSKKRKNQTEAKLSSLMYIYTYCTCTYVAMPIQYTLRRLFHLMNIQTHRNSTQKALILGAYFNS